MFQDTRHERVQGNVRFFDPECTETKILDEKVVIGHGAFKHSPRFDVIAL